MSNFIFYTLLLIHSFCAWFGVHLSGKGQHKLKLISLFVFSIDLIGCFLALAFYTNLGVSMLVVFIGLIVLNNILDKRKYKQKINSDLTQQETRDS